MHFYLLIIWKFNIYFSHKHVFFLAQFINNFASGKFYYHQLDILGPALKTTWWKFMFLCFANIYLTNSTKIYQRLNYFIELDIYLTFVTGLSIIFWVNTKVLLQKKMARLRSYAVMRHYVSMNLFIGDNTFTWNCYNLKQK